MIPDERPQMPLWSLGLAMLLALVAWGLIALALYVAVWEWKW